MPAVSVAQRKTMGMAKAIQEGKMEAKPGTASAEIAASMKAGDLEEFAKTKEKGLPEHKGKVRRAGANPAQRKPQGVRMANRTMGLRRGG